MKRRNLDGSYTSSQVLQLTGITYRQLHYWLEKGVISCNNPGLGRGKVSKFTFTDVLEVKVVAHLVASGVKLSVIKTCIKQISKEFKNTSFVGGLRSVRILTDGKRLYAHYYGKENQIVELTEQGQYGFSFGFDLNEQQNSLIEMAKNLNIALPIKKRA